MALADLTPLSLLPLPVPLLGRTYPTTPVSYEELPGLFIRKEHPVLAGHLSHPFSVYEITGGLQCGFISLGNFNVGNFSKPALPNSSPRPGLAAATFEATFAGGMSPAWGSPSTSTTDLCSGCHVNTHTQKAQMLERVGSGKADSIQLAELAAGASAADCASNSVRESSVPGREEFVEQLTGRDLRPSASPTAQPLQG